jgi:hypothetical protein
MKRKSTDMLTARTFAKEKGVSCTTIMAWLRDSLVPGAAQEETPMGMVWQIPASSLEKVEKRKPGPKPAAASKAKKGAARRPNWKKGSFQLCFANNVGNCCPKNHALVNTADTITKAIESPTRPYCWPQSRL